MQQLQKVSILLYSYPKEDFWKRNSFLKLWLDAFEIKKSQFQVSKVLLSSSQRWKK